MKRYKSMVNLILAMLLMTSVTGCKWGKQTDYSPYKHIFLEEEAHLNEDASSPFCDFSMDYTCLNEKSDSIAMLINQAIQGEFLGEEYISLVPEMAIDSFKNVYLRNYREEVGPLYMADLDKSTSREMVPAWYAQTYSLVTFVEEGRGGIVMNATANYFVDMGGAHPNQWSRWLNINTNTGKLLTKEDVFKAEAKSEIETMLMDKLFIQQAALYPDETLKTLEDLHEKGVLQWGEIYIPDNFLLRKNNIQFLFNRYDIAPYSAGEIILELDYEEIGHYLKNN